ncbi:MAG: histidinol-phosphatase [Bacteroidia bacterium 43-41]|mgnify:CR=1 FL=1|nr:MAG: histidinol-phosphatase [Bacteroidia bacterium 43-41]
MVFFKADLHIHTCLSPCGSLEMSPWNIVQTALEKGLDIIAITDHNSTQNVRPCVEIGEKLGIFVIPGCEVNTQEEVHCLCYFPGLEAMERFQQYLDEKIPDIKNEPALFGYQVAVDRDDVIVYEEERSLYTGIRDDIESVQQKVHSLGGVFVPAHIDRMKNGIYGQLGFIPFDLQYDALEISRRMQPEDFLRQHPEIASKKILRSSDAHFLNHIASVHTVLEMERPDWESFKKAFYG